MIEDIPRLDEIYRQFWNEPSDAEKMKVTFHRLQEDDAYIFLSAVENNNLVGTVMGIVCGELYGSCRPFLLIENLIVDRGHRTKGIARALLAELEMRAKGRDCHQMILVTEANRKDACAFYKANGFQLNNAGFKKKL